MPAKNLVRRNEEGIYSHIYNKGIEKRIIFNDEDDYKTFQGFLRDYLTPPKDPESTKQDFTVHGRVFRGTPHQPKNYFNEVELIAYSLMPDHFHLLLHQLTRGSLEKFIRSLCTRYSMYFNKKYQRQRALYEGPYKSAVIRYGQRLPHLTYYFHHHSSGYSSYPEYLGERESLWVKPKVVLSFFEKGAAGYKYFVEKYKPDQRDETIIDEIALEDKDQYLERRIPERTDEKQENPVVKSRLRIPAFLATSVAIYLLLFTLGVRNINISTVINSQPLPSPAVLAETEEATESASAKASADKEAKSIGEVKPKIILTVELDYASASANIREKPATDSAKISIARDGDTFEFVSENSDWYEIKLPDGSTGFIFRKLMVKEEEHINE